MAITSQDIQNYLAANPGMTDAQIASAMQQYGVTPTQMAQATNVALPEVQSRYDAATQQNLSNQITSRASEILASGGNAFDIAREASKAGLSARDLSLALNIPEQEITQLSGGVLNGTPARPTFSGVAAEFNVNHMARFGTPLNLAKTSSEAVQRQIADLQAETAQRQAQWDLIYGNTPEGKAIQANPPPDWRQFYEPWSKSHVDQFGKIIDRAWSADQASIDQKRAIDQQYINAVNDYNKKYGTNIAPDPNVLGTFAQPSEFYKQEEKQKWYENPLNLAAAAAALYFGAPLLAESLGATGMAGGTGLTAGAGGVTGLTAGTGGATGLLAPAGFTLAPELGASLLAAGGASNAGLLDTTKFPTSIPEMGGGTGLTPTTAGQGLQVPTSPNIASMGGAQGLTVPVTSGTITQMGLTPTGATPVLGNPSSFINNPEVLGQPIIQQGTPTGISPTDALRAANTIRQLAEGQQQQKTPEQQAGQMAAGVVDYSGLLNLLASKANTSGLLGTQFQPQPINLASLLG